MSSDSETKREKMMRARNDVVCTLHIDDLDGAVTRFKISPDEEHREVIRDLITEITRLRETIENIEGTAHDYDHPEVEEIISMCLEVMDPGSPGYNHKIPWKNVHSGPTIGELMELE